MEREHTSEAAESAAGPAGGRRAGRTRARRRQGALTAGALGLAAALTAGVLAAGSTGAGAPEGGGGQRDGAVQAAGPAARDLRTMADPEICEDGRNTAESYSPSRVAGDAVRRIQNERVLVVGVDQNSYLWGYRGPDNEIVGFDIDLVWAIAEDLLGPDPDVIFKAVPTSERFKLLAEREIDMVVRSVSITCQRWQDDAAFSAAYFEAGQQILAPRSSEITGFDESLDGQRVCSSESTTARTLLEERAEDLNIELVKAGNHLDCLVLIQLGEADALMSDSALAAGHAAQDPAMHLVGDVMTLEPYGVAMHQDDVDLVRRVNSVLEEYTSGGAASAWRQSYDEWLAEHMDASSATPPDPLYRN